MALNLRNYVTKGPSPYSPAFTVLAAAGATVTATASETQGASASFPANLLTTGSVIRCRWQGIQTAVNGVDTITVKIRFGSTTLTGTVLVAGAATTGAISNVFDGEYTLTCRAVPGAAAAFIGRGEYYNPGLIAVATSVRTQMSTTNFASNAALLIEGTIQFNSASAGNSARFDEFIVEVL